MACRRRAGSQRVSTLPRVPRLTLKHLRGLLLVGVAALALAACASNRTTMRSPDFSGQSRAESQATLSQLAAAYKAHPKDKSVVIYYAAALRAAGQPEQAVAVLEAGIAIFRNDLDIKVAYAKALSAAGRFDQALRVTDDSINPASPDWNALLVKGAILDQSGRNDEARAVYGQALTDRAVRAVAGGQSRAFVRDD